MGSRVNCKIEFGVSKDNTLLAFLENALLALYEKVLHVLALLEGKLQREEVHRWRRVHIATG